MGDSETKVWCDSVSDEGSATSESHRMMEDETPPWLDKSFLEDILGGGDSCQKVTINDYSVRPAFAFVDNFASHMFRVKVLYKINGCVEDRFISLIVKLPTHNESFKEIIENSENYSKEQKVYNILLPKMYAKLPYEFAPKSFNCPLKSGLVLKDLKAEGYKTCDKYSQMDFPCCASVIVTLARFHAASVACYHDNPKFIRAIGEELSLKSGGPLEDIFKPWVEQSVISFIELLKSIDGPKTVIDFLQSRRDGIWKSIVNLCHPKSGLLNVLNHGDCWTNNILFKYSSSREIIDVKLIDFSIPIFGSPVLDLIYFIWTSANENVRENSKEELYHLYVDNLNKSLAEVGCAERFSMSELTEQLKKAVDWLIFVICNIIPIVMHNNLNIVGNDNLFAEVFITQQQARIIHQVHNGKNYRSLLPSILRQFETFILSRD